MKIVVFGHDYPALVTASSLSSNGNQVTLFPMDAPADWQWQEVAQGFSGLLSLVSEQLANQSLLWGQTDSVDLMLQSEACQHAEVLIVSLMSANVDMCDSLVGAIAQQISRQSVLVLQTMHGVGSANRYQQWLMEAKSPVAVVVWPSFMSEGLALSQFQRPERIIIGADQNWAIQVMRDLVRPYNRVQDMLLVVTPAAAELTKYAINSLLALRVSAMNEFANLAELLHVDIEQVRQGVGRDSRIGFNYLYPGAGFGGINFMADLRTTVCVFEQHGLAPRLLSAALEVNRRQQEVLFYKVWQYFEGNLGHQTFALWGLAYKPNASSVGCASSLPLVNALLAQGVRLRVHDPKAMTDFARFYPNHPSIVLCHDPYVACEGSDALLIMTEWKVYWNPDFERLKSLLSEALIFDGRNIYEPVSLAEKGFRYFGVGRQTGQ